MKRFTILLLLMIGFVGLQSQSITGESISKMMFKAYVTNSSILWQQAIDQIQKVQKEDPSADLKLNLAYAYFGQAGHFISKRDKSNGLAAIESGKSIVEQFIKDGTELSQSHALMAAFYGMSIAFNPMKGMSLGPKSDSHVKKALKHDEKNPFAWMQKASSLYNTPRIFGGSVNKSIDAYKKSIDLAAEQNQAYDWKKVDAMVWLGQAYHYQEQYTSAVEIYQQILDVAPEHTWVSAVLLPKSQKAIK